MSYRPDDCTSNPIECEFGCEGCGIECRLILWPLVLRHHSEETNDSANVSRGRMIEYGWCLSERTVIRLVHRNLDEIEP